MSKLIRYSRTFAAMVVIQSQSQLSQYRKGEKRSLDLTRLSRRTIKGRNANSIKR